MAQGDVGKARAQQAENEAWAKTPGAREVLAQPPFDADGGGTTSTMLDSLEDFLQVGCLYVDYYCTMILCGLGTPLQLQLSIRMEL